MEQNPSDPFAFLLTHSKPSLSQEDKLQNCPFAGQSQTFSNSCTQSICMSSQPVGIIMESPPDSQPNSIEDKYLTPPEHHASDSGKPNLHTEWCDCVAKDHDTEINEYENDDNRVSNREITLKKIIEEKFELVETQETENVDTECIDTDVVLDSEGHCGEMKLSEDNLQNDLDLVDKDKCEGDGGGKGKALDGNVGDDSGVNVISRDESENSSGCCRDVDGVENGGHKDDVDIRRSGKSKLRGRKRMLPESFKNEWGNANEYIEKFKYVKTCVGVDQRGKDESVSWEGNVKLSMVGKGSTSEVCCGNVEKGNSSFLNLVLKLIKSEVDCDYEVDFEETLSMKGIVFPRPRWWPAEGFN